MTQWQNGFNAGTIQARAELAPLVEAVRDAIIMFKDIEKARELPPTAQVQQQYIAMGKQLERLLVMSALEDDEG